MSEYCYEISASKRVCDFCDKETCYETCLVCGKDICHKCRTEIKTTLIGEDQFMSWEFTCEKCLPLFDKARKELANIKEKANSEVSNILKNLFKTLPKDLPELIFKD